MLQWISDLKSNGWDVHVDDNLLSSKRNLSEIDINQDEIPF